ncbi:MAG: alpha/beta fold hydrolase [Planctomycetaceae bacterium]
MKSLLLALAFLLGISSLAFCQSSAPPQNAAKAEDASQDDAWKAILHEELAGGPPELMLNRYLLKEVAKTEQKILETSKALDTPEKLHAWQQQLRKQFLHSLGRFPERTPLNARTTGTVERETYRVEKILFESRPKHFVSAALFLPNETKFKPPYPGVLIPCGHSQTGKGINFYQRGGVIAASNGMAALIYDPIDQGERMQQVNVEGKFTHFGVGGHNKVGISAQLLGWNNATFCIWDGMRAIDYLTSRPDIAPERIGCMGNSGGGTLTTYLTALDERIKVASPNCYITTLSRVCSTIGPQDAEQNIFGQLGFGMDHADMLLLRAPNTPLRIGAAQQDFFPIAGAREAFSRAHDVFARFGNEAKMTLAEDTGPHGWSEPLRMASNQWMSKWLRGSEEITQPPLEDMGIPENAILASERGQVMLIPGARSAYDIMRDELSTLEKKRPTLTSQALQEAVRRRAGILPLPKVASPQVTTLATLETPFGMLRHLTMEITTGVKLPSYLLTPTKPSKSPILMVHGEGKLATKAAATSLAEQGHAVLTIDLSGFGETQGCKQPFYGSTAKDEPDAVVANLLGRTLVGMRAEEAISTARWLAKEFSSPTAELYAFSWGTTPALHAAAAEPTLFSKVVLAEPPLSWTEVVRTGDRHRFSDLVHGALQDYDQAALIQACQAQVTKGP